VRTTTYRLQQHLVDQWGGPVPYGMIPIFCFLLRAGSRLESAAVYSRWADDEGELFTLKTKWKDYDGGCSTPVASIEEALAYVQRDEKP